MLQNESFAIHKISHLNPLVYNQILTQENKNSTLTMLFSAILREKNSPIINMKQTFTKEIKNRT